MRADSYYGVRTYTPQGGGRSIYLHPSGGGEAFFCCSQGGANLFFAPPEVVFANANHIINATSLILV